VQVACNLNIMKHKQLPPLHFRNKFLFSILVCLLGFVFVFLVWCFYRL
jgi:hypothetical protein